MKRIKKLSLFVICCAAILCCGLLSAFAVGENKNNALAMTSGKTYTQTWTEDDYSSSTYGKITLSSNGLLTVSVAKAIDDYGDEVRFDLSLYDAEDSSGTYFWYEDPPRR